MITVSHDPIDVDIALRQQGRCLSGLLGSAAPVGSARPRPVRHDNGDPRAGQSSSRPSHQPRRHRQIKQRDRGPIRTSA